MRAAVGVARLLVLLEDAVSTAKLLPLPRVLKLWSAAASAANEVTELAAEVLDLMTECHLHESAVTAPRGLSDVIDSLADVLASPRHEVRCKKLTENVVHGIRMNL